MVRGTRLGPWDVLCDVEKGWSHNGYGMAGINKR